MTYDENLLIVIPADKTTIHKPIHILKNGAEKPVRHDVLVLNYEEDFESLVTFPLPAKSRKPHTLLSRKEIESLLDEITYVTLAFDVDGLPYAFGINHIVVDGKLYFHCGRKGFKLNGIGRRACFTLSKDLGLAKAGTHNFKSIQMFGTLKVTEDYETKKKCLNRIIDHNNPNHVPFADRMTETTTLIEFDVDYMIGRENIYE